MSSAALFLGGAKDRLLPASIPFRFFATATVFHILFWIVLFFAAQDVPTFTGGPGLVLSAIHLATLGVLAMTAMGAAFQLLPVATRQPLVHVWPARLCFWLFAPGTAVLAYGMAQGPAIALYLGGGAVSAGLLLFAVLTADNLRRAGSLPIVAAHGWLSLVALAGFVTLAVILIFDLDMGFLENHQSFAVGHMVLATFGFMGALIFGFSPILIPMFALSRALPARLGWVEFSLLGGAVGLALVALITGVWAVMILAAACGLGASGSYLWMMRGALQSRMRKRLGPSFIIIRTSWALLAIGMLVGAVVLAGAPIPNGITLFGFLTLAGWQLTFLMGILQRIMPFLASMHAAGNSGKPALMSELTAQTPLNIHTVAHFGALVFCSAGIVMNAPLLISIGAIAGAIGAVSFGVFALLLIRKL